MIAVQDPAVAGRAAGELQRRLDRLGAAVAEVDAIHPGRAREQLLGEQPREQRQVELHHVGELGVEDVVQRLPDDRVVAPDAVDAEARQEVEIAVAVDVVVPRAARLGEDAVEADRAQGSRHLRVEVLGMQVATLGAALLDQRPDVEAHGDRLSRTPWPRVQSAEAARQRPVQPRRRRSKPRPRRRAIDGSVRCSAPVWRTSTTARAMRSAASGRGQRRSYGSSRDSWKAVRTTPGRTVETVTPAATQLGTQRVRERLERRLGRAVRRLARNRDDAGDGGDEDQRAPELCSTSDGIAARASSIGARRLTSSSSWIRDSGMDANGPVCPMPALAITASTRPCVDSACSMTRGAWPGWATSATR